MSNSLDHPHQQAIMLTDAEWDDLKETGEAIENSLLYGSPEPAIAYGREIMRSGMLKGVKMAKFLYELKAVWDSFDTDDRVEDYVFRELGVPIETFTKYTQAYEWTINKAPIGMGRAMAGKPIGSLILLIAASREGQLTDEDWKDLTKAHDKGEIQAIVRRARGIQAGAHAGIVIVWEADGRVRARKGNSHYEDCFIMPHKAPSELVEAVIERVVRAAGIVRR